MANFGWDFRIYFDSFNKQIEILLKIAMICLGKKRGIQIIRMSKMTRFRIEQVANVIKTDRKSIFIDFFFYSILKCSLISFWSSFGYCNLFYYVAVTRRIFCCCWKRTIKPNHEPKQKNIAYCLYHIMEMNEHMSSMSVCQCHKKPIHIDLPGREEKKPRQRARK